MIRKRSLLALASALATAATAFAQNAPTIISATQYTVKQERAADLAAAIKEYSEVLRKAHWDKSLSVWRSNTGPAALTVVTFFDKFAELDSARGDDPKLKDVRQQLTDIARRINESFSSTSRVVWQINKDVSLPVPASAPGKLALWTASVKPGREPDVANLFKTDFLPYVKSGGGKVFVYSEARFGAPTGRIQISGDLEHGFGDFDQQSPAVKAMGAEKYKAFVQKLLPMIDSSEWDISTYDAELSYVPGK
jgi:hypothetical protein